MTIPTEEELSTIDRGLDLCSSPRGETRMLIAAVRELRAEVERLRPHEGFALALETGMHPDDPATPEPCPECKHRDHPFISCQTAAGITRRVLFSQRAQVEQLRAEVERLRHGLPCPRCDGDGYFDDSHKNSEEEDARVQCPDCDGGCITRDVWLTEVRARQGLFRENRNAAHDRDRLAAALDAVIVSAQSVIDTSRVADPAGRPQILCPPAFYKPLRALWSSIEAARKLRAEGE